MGPDPVRGLSHRRQLQPCLMGASRLLFPLEGTGESFLRSEQGDQPEGCCPGEPTGSCCLPGRVLRAKEGGTHTRPPSSPSEEIRPACTTPPLLRTAQQLRAVLLLTLCPWENYSHTSHLNFRDRTQDTSQGCWWAFSALSETWHQCPGRREEPTLVTEHPPPLTFTDS